MYTWGLFLISSLPSGVVYTWGLLFIFSIPPLVLYIFSGNENTESYQVEIVILIKHWILITNSQGNVYQPEGRIKNQILGVKSGFLYLYNVLFQVLLDKNDGISSRIESLKKKT